LRFGGDQQADVVPDEPPQLVLHRNVLRLARGDGQNAVVELQRDHPIQLGHGIGHHLSSIFRGRKALDVDGLHVELFGQGLDQLLIGDQPHVLGDLADQLSRVLVLFLDQHFQLVVGDEPHVDEDLSDATQCHNRGPF
jgi:hypothetical protein